MQEHLNKDFWYNPYFRKQVTVATLYPPGQQRGRRYLEQNQDVLAMFCQNVVCYISNSIGGVETSTLSSWNGQRTLTQQNLAEILLTLVNPAGEILHDQIPLYLLVSKSGRQVPISGNFDLNQSYFTFLEGSVLLQDSYIVLSFMLMEKR